MFTGYKAFSRQQIIPGRAEEKRETAVLLIRIFL